VWVTLSLIFNAGLFWKFGSDRGLEFLTGYLIEKSLSVDNIFVFIVIFGSLRIPPVYQHRVLYWGILSALVMRAAMIFAGVAMLQRFHWLIYVFGVFLIYTGVKLYLDRNKEEHPENSKAMQLIRRLVPSTDQFAGHDFFTIENGRRIATPLLLVLVLVEFTDLIFAINSIPAIFGVTRDPFIVFTSNIFAVLGLRTLYFLLAAVVDRFYLLKYGLAAILTFVGAKMIGERWLHVPILLSLGVVLALLLVSITASLIWPQRDESTRSAHEDTGSMFGDASKKRQTQSPP